MEKLNEKEKEELKRKGPSELAISLRKKKINQIIGKDRIPKEINQSEKEIKNYELDKLYNLSKILYEEENFQKINDILDQLYFFLINIKTPIETSHIDISALIQHLYTKIILNKDKESLISKSFDIFDQIIRLTPSKEDKYIRIFNQNYSQILYELIDFYQNNNKIMEKIFTFLTNLVLKSNGIKEYLMINPGLYLIQALFSLDTKYPLLFIKLITAFCSYEHLNDRTMKNFEILFIEKCDKIISLFYEENHNEPKDVINNSFIFQNIYKCLSYISQSVNNEILDIFLIGKRNDISLYEKILVFVKFDLEHLSYDLLKITGNLYCCSDLKYIRVLIECKSYQWVMDTLLQRLNNSKILNNAAWALSNFVNNEIYRKIFINRNYLNDLIVVLKTNSCFEVRNEVLQVILNLFDAVTDNEIISFIGSNIVGCCCELLINLKEPNLLRKVLLIVYDLLFKGDPNIYLDCYYKNSDDKITNIYKYLFDEKGLDNILSNISNNNKHETVSEIAKSIFEHYYKDANNIIED